MTETPGFAVVTFGRVFDTTPFQDVVTLPELTGALTRFMVKPKLAARIAAEVTRIDQAYAAWKASKTATNKILARFEKAAREAAAAGRDVAEAVAERHRVMRAEARRDAKKDLRLWAPNLYKPGHKRHHDGVLHLSCLVLDYDDGTPILDARDTWAPWFHLLHTTWSHSDARHKFRVILPLAVAVGAADWHALWDWASVRTGSVVDPTGRGLSRAYALPVVPSAQAARCAYSHAGPLLNPVLEGIVPRAADEPLPVVDPMRRGLMHGEPDATWVDHGRGPDEVPELAWRGGAADLDDADLWHGGAVAEQPSAQPRPATPGAGTDTASPTELSVLQRLERLERRLDALSPCAMVDALERLTALYEEGALDYQEFESAKKSLLG